MSAELLAVTPAATSGVVVGGGVGGVCVCMCVWGGGGGGGGGGGAGGGGGVAGACRQDPQNKAREHGWNVCCC